MANMASVGYAIEGFRESLEAIQKAITQAVNSDKFLYEEYKACRYLGYTEGELEEKRLGGKIDDVGEIKQGVLRFCAEERWGLQDFEELLRQKFPDIKVYWVVEESDNEVYCTNDKEGKYFPERYFCDTAQDDIYQSEYFVTEENMYKWLNEITNGRVKNANDVEAFNSDYEDSGTDDENFIKIHEFNVM